MTDTELLDEAQRRFLGADFRWGDPPSCVIVIEIPRNIGVNGDLRKTLADCLRAGTPASGAVTPK